MLTKLFFIFCYKDRLFAESFCSFLTPEIWIHLYLSQNNVLTWLSISFNSFSLVHCLVIFKKNNFSLAFIYCLSVPFSPEGNNYLSYTNDIVRNTDDKVQTNLKSKEQGD